MYIRVRIGLEPAAVAPLRRDLELDRLLAPALKVSPVAWVTVDSESAAFERIVESGRHGLGFRYTPSLEFTEAELDSAEWLELRACKVLHESDADHKHNTARSAGAPWVCTGPRRAHRVLRDLSLSRIKLRALEIGAAEEWIDEWIVPRAVLRLLVDAGLTGLAERPVAAGRHGHHESHVQLDTSIVMPPALEHPGMVAQGLLSAEPSVGEEPEIPPPPGARTYRLIGALVYPAGASLPAADLARTAEAFDGWGQPTWVARQRVRDAVMRNSVRGWGFRVVLSEGSALHAEYMRLWRALQGRVARNPQNRLW